MTRIKFLSAAFLLSSVVFSQDAEQHIPNSRISHVTVFLNGAQVTRQAEVSVEKGITTLVFDGISPNINPQSIQLSGTAGVTLMSVVHKINYLSEAELPRRVTELQDSIEHLNFIIDQLHDNKFVLEQELSLLLENKNIRSDKGMDMAQLEEMQELYRKRLPAIKEDLLKLNIQEKRYSERINRMTLEMGQVRSRYTTGNHEIVASIKADAKKTLKLILNYYNSNASWTPTYEVRSKGIGSPVQLIYKANITQNTGEEWKDVNLKLSTGNPNLSGMKPELDVAFLGWEENMTNGWNFGADKQENDERGRNDNKVPTKSMQVLSETKAGTYAKPAFQMKATALGIEFTVPLPYTIPSSGKTVTVDAQVFEMAAEYKLAAVPKLDKSAFLIARVSGREELNQLNGMANVYFEGTYTGQSHITRTEEDTLLVSLGRDNGIIIDRKKLKEMSSRAFLGSNKKEQSVWEISVRNAKSAPMEITIEDQVPVNTDKDIEVTVDDMGGATYDEATGKLTWKLTLPPGETKKLKFGFTVKYPKSKRIGGY
ncbi:MAG: mucoidy inhibitor MuiA family protein [Flavobacteriaceae bacterium]|nr:mucoidy inhibitor MuiA family protein [Flavobacteriaceae bacterium]